MSQTENPPLRLSCRAEVGKVHAVQRWIHIGFTEDAGNDVDPATGSRAAVLDTQTLYVRSGPKLETATSTVKGTKLIFAFPADWR